MTTRPELVAAARGWLGTPYRHQGRRPGVGVDCGGLVVGVARAFGLFDPPDFDLHGYARSPDGVTLRAACEQQMRRITAPDMQPGDVVMVAFDRDPQHLGILGDYRHGGLSIIHACERPGRVIETRLMFGAHMRFCAAYAFKLRGGTAAPAWPA